MLRKNKKEYLFTFDKSFSVLLEEDVHKSFVDANIFAALDRSEVLAFLVSEWLREHANQLLQR